MKTANMAALAVIVALCSTAQVWANTAPTVSNVTANQRTDGSGIVDIYYTLADGDNDRCTITVQVSDSNGGTWGITPSGGALSGDLNNVYPGNRHIAWASKNNLPGVFGSNYRINVTADDGYNPLNMTWVYINDSGAGMKDFNGNPIYHGGFTGYMTKYETTNAQFAQYLNAAKASNDITVSGSYVKGASGPYSGQNYYYLAGTGLTYDGATNGGAARINWTGSSFTVDSGFENHPVTYVSWYGAMAFAAYYGWRLPTEWEWQAVADYTGSYGYGCGPSINHSIANYLGSNHPYGTRFVGSLGDPSGYGYGMCDLAGNVWEWTSSVYSGSSRVLRGGSWRNYDYNCTVAVRNYDNADYADDHHGFRICR